MRLRIAIESAVYDVKRKRVAKHAESVLSTGSNIKSGDVEFFSMPERPQRSAHITLALLFHAVFKTLNFHSWNLEQHDREHFCAA